MPPGGPYAIMVVRAVCGRLILLYERMLFMMKLRVLMRWMAAFAASVAAALLCWQCVDIWHAGSSQAAYTAEIVGGRLRLLALPLMLCAAVILLAVLMGAGVPERALRGSLTPENRLRLMKARVATLPEKAMREERFRRYVRLAVAAVLTLCAVMTLAFLLDGRNFASWELETVLAALLRQIVPWMALAMAALWGGAFLCDRSCLRECEALRGLPAGKAACAPEKAAHTGVVRLILYAAAVVFIVLGVMNGGLYDVLVKAVNICTECIGLG